MACHDYDSLVKMSTHTLYKAKPVDSVILYWFDFLSIQAKCLVKSNKIGFCVIKCITFLHSGT